VHYLFPGSARSNGAGGAVAGAGDLNGDGFDDVVVGAHANGAGGANAGRAYVYHGGPAVDAVADLTLTGAETGDRFGFSVGSAGDVNGDGFDDVIVGAYANDAGGTDAGRAYVYDCNHHVVTGLLGETTLGLLTPLAAWPSPYRGGDLIVSFATLGGLQGGMGPAEVVLYDVAGRAVRTIVRGAFAAGSQRAAWDGLDEKGSPVSSGTYFLRVRTAGNTHTQKLVVIR
jgi:hypothetical protein